MLITLVTGTRPNLVKAAPLLREFDKQEINYHWVHTGQHYDRSMFSYIVRDLSMPMPRDDFQAHYSDPVEKIAHIMRYFQSYCHRNKPNLVLVLGDVDSTLAAALVANKLKIPLAHVEAGERSYNRSMPEEINRILVDNMSQYLFCASRNAKANLQGEGLLYKDFIQAGQLGNRVFYVGNLMIDQLKYFLATDADYVIRNEDYAVLTLHRQENVDDPETLAILLKHVGAVAEKIRIYFLIHPRTQKRIAEFKLGYLLSDSNVFKMEPWNYSEFLTLVHHAQFVMTDSGGLQVETSYMNVPCLTLRNETEWPDTVMSGSNHLVNMIDDEDLLSCVDKIMAVEWRESRFHETDLCKMNAAENITNIIKSIRS